MSYNGFTNKHKFSFTKKHNPNKIIKLNKIGTGTTFFKDEIINKKKLLDFINTNVKNNYFSIMADKLLSEFASLSKLQMIYTNPKCNRWLMNNSKITLNSIPGLFELKKSNNLIETRFLTCNIEEDISYIKILYAFKNTDNILKMKHLENLSKIKILKTFFFINIIKYEDLDLVSLHCYDYLITDIISNNYLLDSVCCLKNNIIYRKLCLDKFIDTI